MKRHAVILMCIAYFVPTLCAAILMGILAWLG